MKSMGSISTITLEQMSRTIKSTEPTAAVAEFTLSGCPFHHQPIFLSLFLAFLSVANAALPSGEVEPFVRQNREVSNQRTTLRGC